jgi:hypothetical protein
MSVPPWGTDSLRGAPTDGLTGRTSEQLITKDVDGSGRSLIPGTIPAFTGQTDEKSRKTSVKIVWFSDRDLNPGPPEYEEPG